MANVSNLKENSKRKMVRAKHNKKKKKLVNYGNQIKKQDLHPEEGCCKESILPVNESCSHRGPRPQELAIRVKHPGLRSNNCLVPQETVQLDGHPLCCQGQPKPSFSKAGLSNAPKIISEAEVLASQIMKFC